MNPLPARGGVRYPRLALAATILASSLSFIDGSVVNVGLPAIAGGLHSGSAGLQWVINAYLLPLGALVLFGGALGDRFGRRRLLIAGIGLFGLASAACAAAPSLGWLIAARSVQGLGAALLMPNSLAILGDTFEGAARGRAIGIWAAVGAATAGLGPLLGGWLIDAIGWRTIFTINLPLGAAAAALAWRYVPAAPSRRDTPLDVIGAALATAGLGATTFGLITGSDSAGWSPSAAAGLAGGAALLVSFLLWERGRGDRAMIPLDLFGSASFVGLTLLTLLLYGALGVLVILLPYGMMSVGGASAAMAGAALLPVTILLALLSPPLGGLAGRYGARPLLCAGSATVAGGFLLFWRSEAAADYWTTLFPALVVIGIGLAAAVAPLTTAVLASVEARLSGVASGFNSAVARTGGLVATACLGRVLASRGDDLVRACHATALVAAAASLAAACCALLVRDPRQPSWPARD